jgi:type IV pilus assembly protein PilA
MRHSHDRNQRGFSLIELLIVVAIILIIAAIAIPNLLRSKMAANEASAVGSMRTLNTACVTYSTTYGGYPEHACPHGWRGHIRSLPTSASSELIDNVLQTGIKTGYSFSFSAATADAVGNIDSYLITASRRLNRG